MTSQILKFLLIATLASCSVGPDYKKESIASPATYKAVGLSSAPPVGNWWASFSDPTLTSLLTKAQQANPQARAALARLDQARAILGLKGADRLPTLNTESLGVRQQDTRRDIFDLPSSPYNKYRSALNLTWELDLWGRVRRSVAQQKALTQATAADYVAALLSTKAEVARDYLALRHLDSEISLLSHTIKLRKENQKLLKVRLDAGTTTPIDSARARSQTETDRAELYRLQLRRTELENALAVLTGSNPSTFKISASSPPRTPTIPAGIPADLLRRRPDVAATERRLAVAAEERGIVIAKYLPKVSLTASGGFAALSTSDLFDSKSRLWTIGPNATFAPLTFGNKKK